MSIEELESTPSPVVCEIDISEGWDTVSQAEIFLRELKKLPFYRTGLLYSGFDGDQIGKSWGSTEGKYVVFCAHEEDINGGDDEQDPFLYATQYNKPAIAAYDPEKLEYVNPTRENDEGYRMKESAAIVGIVRLI